MNDKLITSIISVGAGLKITNQQEWLNGQYFDSTKLEVDETVVRVDTYNTGIIAPALIDTQDGKKGDVLIYDENGYAKWGRPFEGDKELREEYPSLQEAWGVLMEALEEYEMVKKLVQDHDK